MKQIMYIGPDIPGIVEKNQVFTYDPKEKKKKASDIYPAAKKLFVGMDDIVEARNELRKNGSFLAIAYRKLEEKLKGGK